MSADDENKIIAAAQARWQAAKAKREAERAAEEAEQRKQSADADEAMNRLLASIQAKTAAFAKIKSLLKRHHEAKAQKQVPAAR